MQMIWSRAAQARSTCRCSSCLHSATTTVSRRLTAATTRRQLKAGDIFTACYSAMFAAAVVADTQAKDNRRKQWDKVIAEAKAGIYVEIPELPYDTPPVDIVEINDTSKSYERTVLVDTGKGKSPSQEDISSNLLSSYKQIIDGSQKPSIRCIKVEGDIRRHPVVKFVNVEDGTRKHRELAVAETEPTCPGYIIMDSAGSFKRTTNSSWKEKGEEKRPIGYVKVEEDGRKYWAANYVDADERRSPSVIKYMERDDRGIQPRYIYADDTKRPQVSSGDILQEDRETSGSGSYANKAIRYVYAEEREPRIDCVDERGPQISKYIEEENVVRYLYSDPEYSCSETSKYGLDIQLSREPTPGRFQANGSDRGIEIHQGTESHQEISPAEWVDEVNIPHREPIRPVHVRYREQMVSTLVNNLLAQITHLPNTHYLELSLLHDDDVKRQEMGEKILQLRGQFTRLPNFSWANGEIVNSQRSALHKAIFSLCTKAISNQMSIELLVSKICYNLLVSSSPPSIETYHLLLSKFTKLKQHGLGQIVVDSYFEDSRYKSTERTVFLLLDHYTKAGDLAGIKDIRSRMQGNLSNLRILRRAVLQLQHQKAVQEWAMAHPIAYHKGFLIEKSPRNSEIFDMLILSSLELEGVRPALRYLLTALRKGQKIYGGTLSRVVWSCIRSIDYRAGAKLLGALVEIWTQGYLSLAVNTSEDRVRWSLQLLVSLSQYSPSLTSQNISQDMIQGMMFTLQVKSITSEVNRIGKLVDALEDILRDAGDRLTEGQIDLCLHLFGEAELLEKTHESKSEENERRGRLLQVQSLEQMVHHAEIQTFALEGQLATVLSDSFSPWWKRIYRETLDQYELITTSDQLRLALAFCHSLTNIESSGNTFWNSALAFVMTTVDPRFGKSDGLLEAVGKARLKAKLRKSSVYGPYHTPPSYFPASLPDNATSKRLSATM